MSRFFKSAAFPILIVVVLFLAIGLGLTGHAVLTPALMVLLEESPEQVPFWTTANSIEVRRGARGGERSLGRYRRLGPPRPPARCAPEAVRHPCAA